MTAHLLAETDAPGVSATQLHAGLGCADVEAILADAQDEIARLRAVVEARDMEIEILRRQKRDTAIQTHGQTT